MSEGNYRGRRRGNYKKSNIVDFDSGRDNKLKHLPPAPAGTYDATITDSFDWDAKVCVPLYDYVTVYLFVFVYHY